MASNWEEEFDFEGESDKKKEKKEKGKKGRTSNSNDDIFDLENEDKHVKLPILNNKNAVATSEKPAKNNQKINLQQLKDNKVSINAKQKIEKDQEFEQQFEESVAQNTMNNKQKSPENIKKQPNKPPAAQVEKQEEAQLQQPDYDEYGQDFQPHEQEKTPIVNKVKQESSKPKIEMKMPKPPLATRQKRTGDSLAKKTDHSARIQSRNSARSQDRSSLSRAKNDQKKDDPPNKYMTLVQKNCPFFEKQTLQDLSQDKLVRQNDKIRGLIKRFNDQLNQLINKNIMQLKSKKEEKIIVPDEVIKVLQEQKNSNQTVLQTTLKDLQKLKGKEGQLKEEEYQLSLQQKINEAKSTINQYTKLITRLNLQVNNQGNKLSKIDQKSTSGQDAVGNIKNGLVNFKKDQQKNDQTLKKLDIKIEQLNKKIIDAESRFNLQAEEAKQKGYSVQNNTEINKKADQMKKKIQNLKLHKAKTQSLFKTKSQMVLHECDQLKAQIKASQTSTQSFIINCEDVQNQSRKTVQKARKSAKISADLITAIQNIISEMENGSPRSKDGKDQPATFTHPRGAKKYQSQKNVQKINANVVTKEIQKIQDDINVKKPLLFKKKEKEEDKQEERVWKDDKNSGEGKIVEKPKSLTPQLNKFQDNQKKQDQKKKPFVIKKNKQPKIVENDQSQPQKESPKQQKKEDNPEPAGAEVSSIAPRMKIFKRKQDGLKTQQNRKPAQAIQIPQTKIQVKPQQEQQKAIFAPKRFNIKIKDRKSQQNTGYVSSTVEKKVIEDVKQIKEQKLNKKEQFIPKSLNIQKQKSIPEVKKEPIQIAAEIKQSEQQKPKFNLKLKDRQRENNIVEQKIEIIPQIKSKEPIQANLKININLNQALNKPIQSGISKQNNNPYSNPYANQLSGDGQKREREGPVKKAKPIQNNQKFNIYEQAQDITNVKQITIALQDPKPINKPTYSSQQPDLNKLLGISKPKGGIDEDLIVDNKTISKGSKKQTKKASDFFADLQI